MLAIVGVALFNQVLVRSTLQILALCITTVNVSMVNCVCVTIKRIQMDKPVKRARFIWEVSLPIQKKETKRARLSISKSERDVLVAGLDFLEQETVPSGDSLKAILFLRKRLTDL